MSYEGSRANRQQTIVTYVLAVRPPSRQGPHTSPVLGCDDLSRPWLKSNLDFCCADDAVVRGNDSLPATRKPLLSFV